MRIPKEFHAKSAPHRPARSVTHAKNAVGELHKTLNNSRKWERMLVKFFTSACRARQKLMENAKSINGHRLGFAVKALAAPIPSHDMRRWQSGPHLRTSLEYFDQMLDHLAAHRIALYRLSSDFAPYLTHPEHPQFHHQLREAEREIEAAAAKSQSLGVRLSFHPSQYILLNSPDEDLTARSVKDLDWQARLLDLLGQGPTGVVVLHLGGVYDDRRAALDRFCARYDKLPEHIKRRLVIENDDLRYSVADALSVHERTGVPVVFDFLHHHCLNPEGMELRDALEKCLRTWPAGVLPKIHFSSPRTEMRTIERRMAGKRVTQVQAPLVTQHADFVNPFEFAYFLRVAAGLEFDVMLEAKAKDVALLRLCEEFDKRPWLLGSGKEADGEKHKRGRRANVGSSARG